MSNKTAFEYAYHTYLESKESVDDRSLDKECLQLVRGGVEAHMASEKGQSGAPFRVVEVAAGVGAMVERLVRLDTFASSSAESELFVTYTAMDLEEENLKSAQKRLLDMGKRMGVEVEVVEAFGGEEGSKRSVVRLASLGLEVTLQQADVYEFCAEQAKSGDTWDLLVCCAFLDLFDVQEMLRVLLGLVRQGGWFYIPISFDGATRFKPTIDRDYDKHIEDVFHASMNARVDRNGKLIGDSHSGSSILVHLRDIGADVHHVGSSSWIVRAIRDAESGTYAYPANEEYFVRCILHFVEKESLLSEDVDNEAFGGWFEQRLQQLEETTLVYVAHQTDVFGQWMGE